MSKEVIASYFQNAELYDSESPVGVRDYPNYQCEITGKLLVNNKHYDFRLDYSGVGYIITQPRISQSVIAKIAILVLLQMRIMMLWKAMI